MCYRARRHVPTEHLWDVMDGRVRQHPHPPPNQQKLIQVLQSVLRHLIKRLTYLH